METNESVMARDRKYIIRAWEIEPVIPIVEGKGVTVKDVEGKEYIDCGLSAFILSTGHCHPFVIEAIKRQAEKLVHIGLMDACPPAIDLAEKLAEITGSSGMGYLNKTYFGTTGSEAVEISMKMARHHTGNFQIMGLRGAYHGLSIGALGATANRYYRRGSYGPVMPGIIHVAPPYCYRCEFDQTYPDCNLLCARNIERIIATESTGSVAAFMAEPCMAAGGAIIPPDDYLREVKRICEANGMLFIADEVTTGFGRTGKMFGVEYSGVKPDVMAIGKIMGGGLVISATMTSEDIAKDFWTGSPTTLAGNALCCVAGLASIEVLQKENLCENSRQIGDYFVSQLNELASRHELIGDVRGKGLLVGVELVKDRKTKEPAYEEATNAAMEMRKRGVIMFSGGLYAVLRFQPPLVITKEEIDKVVERLDQSLKSIES